MIPKLDYQIIGSMLDNDTYNFTQPAAAAQYAVNGVLSKFGYVNRNDTRFFRYYVDAVREQVKALADLSLSADEAQWLPVGLYYLKDRYNEWLQNFRFDPEAVVLSQRGDRFKMEFTAPCDEAFIYDTPLMAIMSEVWTTLQGVKPDRRLEKRAAEKAKKMKEAGVTFVEGGTRRRISLQFHERVLEAMLPYRAEPGKPGGLAGTSNMMLARKYGLKAVGTYAHAWVMLHQALFGARAANRMAMDAWSREFNALLGTALTDTLTTEVFLRDFGPYFAKLFDGARCDSMDPYVWSQLMLAHYRSLPGNIRTENKQFVYSNGLTDDLAIDIHRSLEGQAQDTALIGGYFTNHMPGYKHPDFVNKLKFVYVPRHGWIEVVKLPDDLGKASGSLKATSHAKYELGLPA